MPALAITLPQFRSAPDATLEALEDGRRLGYAGGFVFDHLWPLGQPQWPALECWTLLAGLAGRLSAIEPGGAGAFRLGTLVTRAGLRPPALLAHMARTVTSVAGAPPILGIGMGDAGNRPENEAFGIRYHSDPTKRAAELVRAIDAVRGPLAGQPTPPIWVGGTSRRAHGLAGRAADASVARRLAELGDAGASWCVLAFVGGSASRMRTLLAKASNLSIRPNGVRRYDR